ncbi:AbiA family abortive infection protein [Synechocystis sp. PCC 7509]|uniref:AbiA family abortive infection protein n=1 Tax=Synechocystis sp. PCC 7509 TaxID=927677 RepID=UPI0002AC236F|nr:AbiA family abortive infection protein [Synechocystis sp. PCC 7509]
MTDKHKGTQLGYFIDFKLWKDALELLKFQIKQKHSNRHFNTLSMFYYEKLHVDCLDAEPQTYFQTKIASSLFYGLKQEFGVFSYVIPKPGLGLRDYKFFTYPMRAVYYTIGLYLLKLSQEFILETHRKANRIEAFYGGNLTYKEEELKITAKNIYFRSFHEQFKQKIKGETENESQDKFILQLDIENYFNEISIPKLLEFLHINIKPSIQASMSYDSLTREQIVCLFQFIANGQSSGIPQSDNNIISSFIGYLYLVFGDLIIDDVLKKYIGIIDFHKIIRYTDDIYISITFKHEINDEDQGTIIHSIASQISEVLYSRLNLKLNLKTRLYRMEKQDEKEELLKNLHKASLGDEYIDTSEEENQQCNKEPKAAIETPQEKLDKVFEELIKIKKSRVEDYFIRDKSTQDEILQTVFDKSVEQILDKPENKNKIQSIFMNFNFDLVKVKPLEILIVLLKDEISLANLKNFCLNKKIITIGDADLILKFLSQTNFGEKKLLLKLKENDHMKDIIDTFINGQLNCSSPGYYRLTCMHMHQVANMPEVIEQTRLRVLSEKESSYSVALNHLLNEIHAICINKEKANKKKYDVHDVIKFLQLKNVPHEICIKIRNLFDRRNSNRISHPGSDDSIAWEVTKDEYWDYYENVGKCLDFLL